MPMKETPIDLQNDEHAQFEPVELVHRSVMDWLYTMSRHLGPAL